MKRKRTVNRRFAEQFNMNNSPINSEEFLQLVVCRIRGKISYKYGASIGCTPYSSLRWVQGILWAISAEVRHGRWVRLTSQASSDILWHLWLLKTVYGVVAKSLLASANYTTYSLITYRLGISAILKKCKHDPDSFRETKHLLIGLGTVPDLFESAETC